MDDRFDIILVSPYVFYGSDRVHVLPETYHALGQDGHHYNNSINSPQNQAIPQNVANALFNQSDHLPVITEFLIDAQVGVTQYHRDFMLKVANPVRDNLTVFMQNEEPDQYRFEIYSIDGRLLDVFEESLDADAHTLNHAFSYPKGIYLLKVSNSKGQNQVVKLVR